MPFQEIAPTIMVYVRELTTFVAINSLKINIMINNESISVPFHWGGGMIAMTIVCLIVVFGTLIATLPKSIPWLTYLMWAFMLVVLIGTAGFTPIHLKADNEKVTLTRLFIPSLTIPKDKIVDIGRLPKSYVDESIRTFGSGGFCGFLGKFRNKTLGDYTMYATELKDLIYILTSDKQAYVFSCTRADEFIEFVRSRGIIANTFND